jgi:outer membrane protein with beta-barrel domain
MSTETRTSTKSTNRARLAAAALFVLSGALGTTSANAQEPVTLRSNGFELRPFAGAYIPTGDQRDLLKDAVIVGGQASYRILPQLAVTGTLGWSPSKDRITPGDQKIDLWQYDVGAELRAPAWFTSGALDFTPFVGLGAGARTYNYRDLDVDSKTNFAGYGMLGGELGFGRIGWRVEARDYVSQFKPFTGGDSKTRNDVTVATGLTLKF